MHILFTTDHYYPNVSGIVTHVLMLREELQKRGHTVYVLTPKAKNAKLRDPHIFNLPSFPVYIRAGDRFTIPTDPVLEKKLQNLPIDIVHNHLFFTGYVGKRIAKKKNIPLIGTYHTFIRQYFDWFVPWAAPFTHPFLYSFTRRYFKDYDAVLAPSNKAVDELRKTKIKSPIVKMHNAIDLSLFRRAEKSLFVDKFKLKDSSPVILIAGILEKGKNIELAIDTVSLLVHKYPKLKLVIAGDGLLRKKLDVQIKSKKLTSNAIITGFLTPEFMASANKACDLVLFTSDTDNFPTVLIEALASSKPIVSVRDKAVLDLVKNNKNGLLAPKNPKKLAAAIDTILTQKNLQQSFGKESSILADKYSIDSYVTDLERLYDKLLTSKSK